MSSCTRCQRPVWFPGGLIRIPAGGDATGGQLAVAAPSGSGRAQKNRGRKSFEGAREATPDMGRDGSAVSGKDRGQDHAEEQRDQLNSFEPKPSG